MKKLEIIRKRGWYGKLRALRLFVDGEEIGSVGDGETVLVALNPDAKTLKGRMDWGSTAAFDLTKAKSGDAIEIVSHFTLNLWRSLGLGTLPIKLTLRAGRNDTR